MEDIILQKFVKVNENLTEKFLNGESLDSIEVFLEKDMKEICLDMLKSGLESVDNLLAVDKKRKQFWNIARRNVSKSIMTLFGNLDYKRTYYSNKLTNAYAYLTDLVVGLHSHQRMTNNVEAKVLERSIDVSYEKSVKELDLSRSMVKDKLHEIPDVAFKHFLNNDSKKRVKTLYLSADEEHVHLQNGKNMQQYLVYVYEGIEAISTTRNQLKNVKYFTQKQGKHEDFWINIATWVEENYDTEYLETLFFSSDGGAWIKEGLNWLPKAKFVLDKFHIGKYIKRATAPFYGTDYEFRLWNAINSVDKTKFYGIIKELKDNSVSQKQLAKIAELKRYIGNNWQGITNAKCPNYHGCSAEGHVSHILSSRLSSRPLGWSEKGADQMAKLRVYRSNGGNVLELVQEKNKPKKVIKIDEIKKSISKKRVKTTKTSGVKPYLLEHSKITPTTKIWHNILYAI